jgi:AraC-like DNA-binding protein
MPRAGDAPAEFDALVGGLHTSPAVIAYEQELSGVQLDLTPRGSRALLGLPAGELAGAVLSLQTLFGSRASQQIERLREAPDWDTRFHLITEMFTRQIGGLGQAPRALEEAWQTILCSGGRVRIADVAARVGYSRRQLDVRFAREYGLAPKQLARIVRFERSHRLLVANPRLTLAWIAASCGYYDQAHMARDWKQFAGCSPSSWLVREELPFVQDQLGVGP